MLFRSMKLTDRAVQNAPVFKFNPPWVNGETKAVHVVIPRPLASRCAACLEQANKLSMQGSQRGFLCDPCDLLWLRLLAGISVAKPILPRGVTKSTERVYFWQMNFYRRYRAWRSMISPPAPPREKASRHESIGSKARNLICNIIRYKQGRAAGCL